MVSLSHGRALTNGRARAAIEPRSSTRLPDTALRFMKRTIAASTLFILFLISGGIWISLTRFLPDGVPRTMVIIGLGAVFVGLFLWLLVTQVRTVLGGTKRIGVDLALVSLNLALLVVAFGWMYHMIGIVDSTTQQSSVVNDFMTCIYYSIVTFTTLGYGDFYPQGPGRVLAAMEALTGYLILGILASTGANVLSPESKPYLQPPEDHEEEAEAARAT
jgi:hypothetical protein